MTKSLYLRCVLNETNVTKTYFFSKTKTVNTILHIRIERIFAKKLEICITVVMIALTPEMR